MDTFEDTEPFAVFASADEAFAKLSKADLDALLANKTKLKSVLTHHVVPGKVVSTDIKSGMVKSVQGAKLTIGTKNSVMVDTAKLMTTDVAADNGVIHAIDTVLIPK